MPTIEWSSLRHAYGPAGDIPALLTRARTAPAPTDFRDEPWFSLWSALCHQGDVFTGSYAAVPDLVAIAELRRAEPRVAVECLFIAAMIELERVASESLTPPPPIPTALVPAYREALARGGTMVAALRGATTDETAQRMLEASDAVFRGEYSRGRLLADGPVGE